MSRIGVGERVHRERVLGGALGAEEVDLGAERQHQVVVGQRRHLGERDLPLARSIAVTVVWWTATFGCS